MWSGRAAGHEVAELPDDELMRRIRLGDPASFGGLVDRYADDLFRLAYSLVGNEPDARDMVQETFLGAFRRASAFAGRSTVKTWLMRILFNRVWKARRSRRVRRALSLDAPTGAAAESDGQMQSRSPAAAVEARQDVQVMLAALPEDYRQVIVLRELQRLTYDEIAGVLSIPVGTVESRLHRARKELRRRFAGYSP